MTGLIQIITGTIGCLGFGILFNIRGRRLAAATVGGFLSWSLLLLLELVIPSEAVNYFIVAVCISLYSEVMARKLRSPTTTFITTSLVPLIPGSSLYYTMAYAFEQNSGGFMERAIHTLALSSALALGIIVAATAAKLWYKNVRKAKMPVSTHST